MRTVSIRNNSKGFTLVEIIVALMIFSIAATVALAALVKIIDANKKAQSINDSVSNLSFAMESMSRELRGGSTYYCRVLPLNSHINVTSLTVQDINTCTGTLGSGDITKGVGFAFLTSRDGGACNLITAYEIVPNITSGGAADGTYSFNKAIQTTCGGSLTFTPVISTQTVTITDYYVQMNNTQFPLAFVRLEGNAGTKENVKTYFNIQTASSPRIP